MNIEDTLAPTSDQLDAVDLIAGARTFTIAKVTKGNAEQPVQVHFAEFDRPWRPGKTMRRLLAKFWTTESSTWVGRRVTLYCDETIKFGGETVGGTRVRALSHIGNKPQTITLPKSRGKFETIRVQPLPDEPHGLDEFRRETTSNPDTSVDKRVAELRAEWKTADPDRRQVIEAEVLRLTAASDGGES